MRAFRHALAAVENRLVAARFHGLFVRHHCGQQVDRLDVAIEEPLILHRDALVHAERIAHLARAHKRPEARLVARPGIRMVAHAHAARHLPVEEEHVALHLIDKPLQQRLHLRLFHRDFDVNQLRAAINAVDVVVKGHRHMVHHAGRVINAVAEIAGAVVHGHHHLLDGRGLSVVICDVLHACKSAFLSALR